MNSTDTETTRIRFNTKRAKTPTVLQMEAVECGAAALAIIMGYYKKFIPLSQLREDCGVSRDGSRASKVLAAARQHGFIAKGFRYEIGALRKLTTPYIVFWNFNHFLVVEGFKGDKVYLNDPATGPRTVSMEEFDLAFTGVVLSFTPGKDFQPEGKPNSVFNILVKRLAGSYFPFIFLVIIGLLLVIPGLLIPVFTKVFIDQYLIAKMQSWVFPLLLGMGATAIVRALLTYIKHHYIMKLETRLAVVDSAKFFWHVLQLPMSFYSQRSIGDIGNRISLNDQVARTLSQDFAASTINVITALFYLTLMTYYNLTLTIVGVTIALMNIAVVRFVSRIRQDKSQLMMSEQGKLLGAAYNGLTIIESLKASGRESDFYTKISGYHAKLVNVMQELGAKTIVPNAVPSLLNALNTAVILGIGGLQVMEGVLTIGTLVAFQSLMASFIQPINELVGTANNIQNLKGSIEKLDDVLNHKTASRLDLSEELPDRTRLKKLSGEIELKNIHFGYSHLDPELIKDFNLHLKPGTSVAIVGSSGSGKSTIAKLISGLYPPWSGEILLDGIPYNDHNRQVLTNSISMVDQDIMLFEGTIKDNLTMWDKTIPEENIVRAAKFAQIHSDITLRDLGYEAKIREAGSNFSGGQRQRIEIARAIVNMPRILIMDEATSALDPITEFKIMNDIRRLGCSLIIIAHRLSTIRNCDEIIVLEKGIVQQRGNHEQLKAVEGPYARLIEMTS